MKRLIWMFAVLMSVSARAEPGDTHAVAFKADDGLSCARFLGSFERSSYQGVWEAKPTLRCDLVEKKGSSCVLTNHGINGLGPIPFDGKFGWIEKDFLVMGKSSVLMFRLICTEPGNCPQLQVWNSSNMHGFACDMHPLHAPVQKSPKAPREEPSRMGEGLKI